MVHDLALQYVSDCCTLLHFKPAVDVLNSLESECASCVSGLLMTLVLGTQGSECLLYLTAFKAC
jgi:hypothetical protein